MSSLKKIGSLGRNDHSNEETEESSEHKKQAGVFRWPASEKMLAFRKFQSLPRQCAGPSVTEKQEAKLKRE